MTTTQPTETVEDLIRQLDDRCTELSKAESLTETLKAGATALRETLGTIIRWQHDLEGPPAGYTVEKLCRDALLSYSRRLAEWDKVHSRP